MLQYALIKYYMQVMLTLIWPSKVTKYFTISLPNSISSYLSINYVWYRGLVSIITDK